MCLWFAQDLFTLVELCGFISATSPQRCGPNSAADRHAGLTGLQTSQGVRLKHKSLSVDRGVGCPQSWTLHLWDAFSFSRESEGGDFTMWECLEGRLVLDCVCRWREVGETGDWVSPCWRLCSQQVVFKARHMTERQKCGRACSDRSSCVFCVQTYRPTSRICIKYATFARFSVNRRFSVAAEVEVTCRVSYQLSCAFS